MRLSRESVVRLSDRAYASLARCIGRSGTT